MPVCCAAWRQGGRILSRPGQSFKLGVRRLRLPGGASGPPARPGACARRPAQHPQQTAIGRLLGVLGVLGSVPGQRMPPGCPCGPRPGKRCDRASEWPRGGRYPPIGTTSSMRRFCRQLRAGGHSAGLGAGCASPHAVCRRQSGRSLAQCAGQPAPCGPASAGSASGGGSGFSRWPKMIKPPCSQAAVSSGVALRHAMSLISVGCG